MKDPWRIVDPLRAAPIDRPTGKINMADKDMDADLRPSRACILRFKSCSLEIVGTDVGKPEDALAKLANCITALKKTSAKQMLNSVHVQVGDDASDALPQDTPAATLACGRHVVSFVGMSLAHGTLILARTLIVAGRDAKLAPILKANGVIPMLRTT